MNPRVLVALGCLAAAPLSAQTSSAVSASGQPLYEETYNGELRLGLTSINTRLSSVLDGTGTATFTGTLTGADLLARARNIGVYLRTLSGDFGAQSQGLGGKFKRREARVMLGEPGLSAEGGVIWRTTSRLDADSEQTIYRGGFRSQWTLGSSGLGVSLVAGLLAASVAAGSDKTLKVLGGDGEATLFYQAPRGLPLYIMAGWRYERFDDLWSANKRSEEQSGPILGLGFRLAARPVLR